MTVSVYHNLESVFSWQSKDKYRQGTFRSHSIEPIAPYQASDRLFSRVQNRDSAHDRSAIYTANMFVGFSKENTHRSFPKNEVILTIKRTRNKQLGRNDTTIAYVTGDYTCAIGSRTRELDGLQIGFVNIPPALRKPNAFTLQIAAAARDVCRKHCQDIVIVRIDRDKQPYKLLGVCE